MEAGKFRLDDFELYQLACTFRRRTYALLKKLPADERYCLGSQMRRAAISVTNNIAEGHGRWHYQENIHFCRISRGSIEELMDDFNICEDEGYATPELITALKQEAEFLIARINGYMQYLRRAKAGDNDSPLTTHCSPLTRP